MDKEEIESTMNKILKQIEDFNNEPSYAKALSLDMNITVLRFLIGEQNFLPLHYFRNAHENAIKFIDEYQKKKSQESK